MNNISQRHAYNIILKGFEGIDRLDKSGAQEYKKKTRRLALLVLFGDFSKFLVSIILKKWSVKLHLH